LNARTQPKGGYFHEKTQGAEGGVGKEKTGFRLCKNKRGGVVGGKGVIGGCVGALGSGGKWDR